MRRIDMPIVFKEMCRNLDLESAGDSVASLVGAALQGLDVKDAPELRRFFDEVLLSGSTEPDALREWWWTTPSTLVFYDTAGFMTFLTAVRERLSSPPYT
jgi:hypothetical protein